MSRIDGLLSRSADEVRQAVAAMPDREVTTVSETSTRKTYLSVAYAVGGVIVVALLGWALFGFGGAEEVDPIQPTPTPVDPDATPLPLGAGRISTGSFATDFLGPTFSFSVDGSEPDTWYLQQALSGLVIISHPSSEDPGDRTIIFAHPKDPAELSNPDDPYRPGGWPLDDIDGWLDAAADWVVEGPADTTVGGWPATTFALAGTPSCRDPEGLDGLPCPAFVSDGEDAYLLGDGVRNEVWWIEGVDGFPLVIIAVDSEWTDAFRADVEAIVASWAAEAPLAP